MGAQMTDNVVQFQNRLDLLDLQKEALKQIWNEAIEEAAQEAIAIVSEYGARPYMIEEAILKLRKK